MSLKFLAVGQSFAGMRGDKSPFALRKENQLPTFPGAARFAGRQTDGDEKVMVQTDFIQHGRTEESAAELETATINPSALSQTPLPSSTLKPKRRWFSMFRLRWFRAQPSRADLVQSELSLEKVRVLRNDLADSDLQLVLRKRKKAKPVFTSAQENNGLPRQGWTELTARLFELGQK